MSDYPKLDFCDWLYDVGLSLIGEGHDLCEWECCGCMCVEHGGYDCFKFNLKNLKPWIGYKIVRFSQWFYWDTKWFDKEEW